jgi:SAM-dependent methyltransferase
MSTTVGALHERFVFSRRVKVLAAHMVALIPQVWRVVDIGCGDGTLDHVILQSRPDVSIVGLDVLVRPSTRISVQPFDGHTIPYPDGSFDAAMLVDVLHHASDPLALLREAARVGKTVLIKDHFREGLFANLTLRFMDWVGNAYHGVALPYIYWSKSEWGIAFSRLDLKPTEMNLSLGLYPIPASWIFEGGLHFVTRLQH